MINYDFPYAYENKLYHTLAFENQARGYKLYKASLDAGFTCPNLDGSKGTGGLHFLQQRQRLFHRRAGGARWRISLPRKWPGCVKKIRRLEPWPIFRLTPTPMLLCPALQELYERALRCEGSVVWRSAPAPMR